MVVLSAIARLPNVAPMIVALFAGDEAFGEASVAFAIALGFLVMEAAVGLALIRGKYVRAASIAYLAGSLGVVVLEALTWEYGMRLELVALAIQALGGPMIVVLAPRLLLVGPRAGTAGILIVLGGAACFAMPIQYAAIVRYVGASAVGSYLGLALDPAIELVAGILAVVAGLRLRAGRPARRALILYMVVAIGGFVVVPVIGMSYGLATDPRFFARVLAGPLSMLLVGVATPLAIWSYAKPELGDPDPAYGGAALPAYALWLVPPLVMKVLVMLRMPGPFDIALAISTGVAAVALAIAGLARVRATWWLATIAAAANAAVTLYVLFAVDARVALYLRSSGISLGLVLMTPIAALLCLDRSGKAARYADVFE